MSIHLGSSAEATFAVNDGGIIIAWNAAAERLLGYSAKRAVGARCHEIMHGLKPSGAPMCGPECPVVESCKHGASARRFQMVVPRPDGTEVPVDVVTVTVYDEGEPIAIHVLNEASSAQTPSEPKPLTQPELSVLRLLVEGLGTEDIAQRLDISRESVRNRVRTLIAKLGVRSRVEAVVSAIRRGLVPPP